MERRYLIAPTLCMLLALSATAKESTEPPIRGSVSIQGSIKKDNSKLAKISLNEAIEVASKKLSGHAREANLENEDSYLVYSVLVVTPKDGLKEVIVDAGNGKILSIGNEDRNPSPKNNENEEDDDD